MESEKVGQAPKVQRGSLYDQYSTSKEREREGQWFNFGPAANRKGDVRIKLARAGGANSRFARAVEVATRPHRRAIDSGRIKPEVVDALMRPILADTVVLAWENVEGRDGELLAFTRENVVKVLEDLPDLYADVMAFAKDMNAFREAEVELEKGNSSGS
jgi:hypothetical protein